MRTAYLIKTNGKTAELVAHGVATDIKKEFISHKLEKDETLLMLGQDIRPKRRGGRQDVTAYLSLVDSENQAMREKLEREAKIREELARKRGTAPIKTIDDRMAAQQADKGKSQETLRIKAEAASRHADKLITTSSSKHPEKHPEKHPK